MSKVHTTLIYDRNGKDNDAVSPVCVIPCSRPPSPYRLSPTDFADLQYKPSVICYDITPVLPASSAPTAPITQLFFKAY